MRVDRCVCMSSQLNRALLHLSTEATFLVDLHLWRLDREANKGIERMTFDAIWRRSQCLCGARRWGRVEVKIVSCFMCVCGWHVSIGSKKFATGEPHLSARLARGSSSPMCPLSSLKGAKAPVIPTAHEEPLGAAFVQMVYTILVTMNIRLFIQCSIEAVFLGQGPAELDFAVSTLGPISSRGLSPLTRGNSKNVVLF